MTRAGTLLLSRGEIAALMTFEDYLAAAEDAFRLHAERKIIATGLLHADTANGEFHIKTGGLYLERAFFGVKANGGFFRNPERYGLPAIQGIIYLADAETGTPLAVLDSVEITRQRTAAATALAAKHLARPDSQVMTVCGAGTQARFHIRAFQKVFPLRRVFVYSREENRRGSFAREMSSESDIAIEPVADLSVVRESDIVVTCTTARKPFLTSDMIKPGTFIGAVGADSPQKQELAPDLMSRGRVVADLALQSARVGELNHAIAAGLLTIEEIHGELGEIVAGQKPGRTSPDQIFIFDSTGTALQDVAAAARAYDKAVAAGRGTTFDFSAANLA